MPKSPNKRVSCLFKNGELLPCKFLDQYGLAETLVGDRVKGMRPLYTRPRNSNGQFNFTAVSYHHHARDKGIIMNFCPWCGQSIIPEKWRDSNQLERTAKGKASDVHHEGR